ncbi:ABC transporter ATP-binding protein [Plantactinospora sp. CA-290183]|uniref:ABC transporter ATP-binding protein n=1 Tax=Plantactinospora sp. CA-290183 TaxID=3240006 RepID=UPI003D939EF8
MRPELGSVLGRPPDQPFRLRQLPGRARGALSVLGQVTRLAWRASRPLTLALGAMSLLTGLVPAATAAVAALVIDAVVVAVRDGPAGPDAGGRILLLVGLQFLVAGLNSAGGAVRSIVERLLGDRLTLTVQLDVMDHASRLELPFFERSSSYDLLRQAQQEAASRPMSMLSLTFAQLQGLVTLVSLGALLFGLSPLLTLLALLAPIPVFVSDARFRRRMFEFAIWASPLRRRMQYVSNLVTTDTAAKEIKLFGLGPHFVDSFRTWGEDLYRRTRRLVTARNLGIAGWGLLATGLGSLGFLYAVRQALAGRLTVGDLVLCSAALIGVQAAAQTLLLGLSAMYQDSLYLATLRSFLTVPAGAEQPDGGQPLHPGPGHVVFENVSFGYPGSPTLALHDVSLEIPPGTTLAVVGRNGAGKSTLIKLLCGLYQPATGRVRLDGQDLREVAPDRLRAEIGAVFQDYVSYQATAAENIGLGDVTRLDDRTRVVASADQAGARGFIERLPQGFDSQLGRWFGEGVEVSGGEWQRIALGRAFMRDARLLVLDEPTAALDAQAEFELFERVRRLAAGRTAVYISHRFSTVRQADRVLLLDGGRIREYGTHDELMADNGEYARLFRLQALAYTETPGPLGTGGSVPPGRKPGPGPDAEPGPDVSGPGPSLTHATT